MRTQYANPELDDEIKQEDVVDTLQHIWGIGSSTAYRAVGKIYAQNFGDLLNSDGELVYKFKRVIRSSRGDQEAVLALVRYHYSKNNTELDEDTVDLFDFEGGSQ
jgi:hypothetical protein